MPNLSKKILAKIKSEKISPREKWIFLVKNYGIWILAVLAIVLAGIFLGNLIADLLLAEWRIFQRFPGGGVRFLASTISIFWLVGILAAGALAFLFLRKTRRGYRLGGLALSGVIFVASLVGGISLLSSSLPGKFLEFRDQHFPPKFESQKWQNPAAGFLFGKIIAIHENSILLLDSLDGSTWEVEFAAAEIPDFLELKIGEKVRAIGEKIATEKFRAEFILPEKPPREFERVRKNLMKEILPGGRINSRSAPQI
ncbi:hypothetical protein K9N08_00785 [Candidatus Gracilibacteria bacterium]|nr:hypothetical protein [Candidatus Gracilibacteria bacterium]MCF7856079.1 hypothetical protein [Candidatus Gracilibacteria bacterium]MCF7896498.1 hypothetical protein [Candidatus Gracilibacteria bacterium]